MASSQPPGLASSRPRSISPRISKKVNRGLDSVDDASSTTSNKSKPDPKKCWAVLLRGYLAMEIISHPCRAVKINAEINAQANGVRSVWLSQIGSVYFYRYNGHAPFNKTKLYPVRPDDRQFVKKRKRSSSERLATAISNGSPPHPVSKKAISAVAPSRKSVQRGPNQTTEVPQNMQNTASRDALTAPIQDFQNLLNARTLQPPIAAATLVADPALQRMNLKHNAKPISTVARPPGVQNGDPQKNLAPKLSEPDVSASNNLAGEVLGQKNLHHAQDKVRPRKVAASRPQSSGEDSPSSQVDLNIRATGGNASAFSLPLSSSFDERFPPDVIPGRHLKPRPILPANEDAAATTTLLRKQFLYPKTPSPMIMTSPVNTQEEESASKPSSPSVFQLDRTFSRRITPSTHPTRRSPESSPIIPGINTPWSPVRDLGSNYENMVLNRERSPPLREIIPGINTPLSPINDFENEEEFIDQHEKSPGMESLSLMTDSYDESILDSFLKRQSERDPFYHPTARELLDTQRWSTIDPRTAWPKKLGTLQKEQKVLEIKARGSRKTNFGKHLRPHIVQERKLAGWDVHQSCERKTDQKSMEMISKLEELFGPGIGNCVPTIIDKQFVMQERGREPEPKKPGRQKATIPLRVFPMRQ
ncbi:uncharacterized protein L3040_001210 [Drepanopeziza brunnea f. sp. 'multigermtubi']|uniref:uncharacterized protein n=1 Tax=Drepanopeziza brunnea f. sp. 'multigermtubi' TaxID=698441 RepID=UPI0023846C9E|nr:hypothetical protein L3040_001210 [Drepanopeziza brunnea f. sp. 'multigermtubi']